MTKIVWTRVKCLGPADTTVGAEFIKIVRFLWLLFGEFGAGVRVIVWLETFLGYLVEATNL